jgi:hypothetical protein
MLLAAREEDVDREFLVAMGRAFFDSRNLQPMNREG